MLNLQNLFRNDTRSVRRGTPGPRHLSTGFGPFPSRGRLDGFQRKANRKHITFKQPTGHFQSDHVALRTFLSSFSENHSSSPPKALLRGLTPRPHLAKLPSRLLSLHPRLHSSPRSPNPACNRQLVISWMPHQGLSANGSQTSSSSPAPAFLFLLIESLFPLLPCWKCLSHP